jgi:hypothetical protein
MKVTIFLFFFILFFGIISFAQDLGFGNLILDEFSRRNNLVKLKNENSGLILRTFSNSPINLFYKNDSSKYVPKRLDFNFLPIYSISKMDVGRPYVGGEYGLIPARGLQGFLSTGFNARFSKFHFHFQPELVVADNLPFYGFPKSFSSDVISDRFFYWNIGDSPERFGIKSYQKGFLGQTFISFRFKSFELGAGTRNFWWGPGQWNSLIFSNNAPGFPHLSFKTNKPARTFLGTFEGQFVIGRLESSNEKPSQNDSLNSQYFLNLFPDWRYLNAIMLSYNPKWVKGLAFGFNRTYQYYNSQRPKDLGGLFPVFEPLAKDKLFTNGNSVFYDDRNQSQQISVFGTYRFVKSKMEMYFEFGRRDHSLNWREFILNPEHARAYQFGFIKLTDIPNTRKLLQVRGEITHQQESVNRYMRYGLNGMFSWQTHGHIRGFGNYGQPLGVGIGTGSNIQTIEVSLVEDWQKLGILFERLENNQDFYFRAFGQQSERKPWIDWSTALIWNTSYKDLFISARLQGTYARNYQWLLSETSTSEFPVSQNLLSLHSQVNVIYFWNRSIKNVKGVKRLPSAGSLNVN